MADDLKDHFDRLDWVRTELRTVLTKEVDDFQYGNPCRIDVKIDLIQRQKFLVATDIKPVPKSIQIRTGVLKNEMRAILDSLVCILAARNGATSFRRMAFPIADDIAEFLKPEMQRNIAKLSATDQSLIATLKPYSGGNDLLYALHVNDRTRKHQRLLLTTAKAAGGVITAGSINRGDQFFTGGDLVEGTVLAKLALDSFPEMKASASVTFSEPAFLAGKELIPNLYDISREVEAALKVFN